MTQRFYELPQKEQDAVTTACARHGFVPDDFEFVVDSVGEARVAIAVERVVGGQYKKYRMANGVAWTASFEVDLAADWFGTPLAD